MDEIYGKLTDYTLALKQGLDSTNHTDERPLITNRLAAAAEMYALLHKNGEKSVIRELVQSEIRAHGWSFISGDSGEMIATKWVAFTEELGIKQ